MKGQEGGLGDKKLLRMSFKTLSYWNIVRKFSSAIALISTPHTRSILLCIHPFTTDEIKALYPYHATSYTTACFMLAFQVLLFLRHSYVLIHPEDMGKYN